MSDLLTIFASIGDHLPMRKKEKLGEANEEPFSSILHYRGTVLLLTVFCILVTSTEWIGGNEHSIQCLHSGPIPEDVINNYCWISGTFTVPGHYEEYEQIGRFKYPRVGNVISSAGVGPYNAGRRADGSPIMEVEVKAYYQWVPFMLFLQAVMFYIPHIIFKAAEGKKLKRIIAGLNLWIMKKDERYSKEDVLADYIAETKGSHCEWALKCLAAQFLYSVNVIGQIFFTDCFLGWEFSKYGFQAASFIDLDEEERVDPMSRVFPRVTKCTFQKYGPSGTVQNHDAQCVLPINIINEKIYVFLWFWMVILACITLFDLILTSGIIFTKRARGTIIKRKLRLNPNREKCRRKINPTLIASYLDFGDWKLFYLILKNVDSVTFAELCEKLTARLQKLEEKKLAQSDFLLPMKNLLSSNDEKENLNKDSDNLNPSQQSDI